MLASLLQQKNAIKQYACNTKITMTSILYTFPSNFTIDANYEHLVCVPKFLGSRRRHLNDYRRCAVTPLPSGEAKYNTIH